MIDENRARGLMEGLAIGNLLGISVEGWPKSKIAAVHPGGIRDIHANPDDPDDDDLAQAIIIADAATRGRLDIEDLARRFWHWADENGAGMGILTEEVLSLYGGRVPRRLASRRVQGAPRTPTGVPIAQASRQAWDGWRAGNGALMRCAPLALRWSSDPSMLVRESVISAVPTHWDPRCGWSAALANLATAAALRGETKTPDTLLAIAEQGIADATEELRPYGYQSRAPESVVEAVQSASRIKLADLKLDDHDMGYTLLTLQAVLICFWAADDFAGTLSKLIEAGGDTDTNGAAAGAILGAKFGLHAIPTRWRAQAEQLRVGRESLTRLADALLAA